MIETIQIYDEQVHDLINQIDQVCHNFDASKYGIPPEPIRNKIKMLVYRWIASQQVVEGDAELPCHFCAGVVLLAEYDACPKCGRIFCAP